jgi:predicted kinase
LNHPDKILLGSKQGIGCIVHIVTGLPGSGKSEVVRIMEDKTNALIVNTDEIRNKMFPTVGTSANRDFTDKELKIVYLCLPILVSYLIRAVTQAHIVFDGTFRFESQRQSIIDEVHQLGHQVYIWYVKADAEIIKQRITCRHEAGRQHADFGTYLAVKRLYEIPTNPWATVDNSYTIPELRSKVTSYLERLKASEI